MIAALFMGVCATGFAQDQKKAKSDFKNMTPEQRAEKQTERMQQALQLDEKQKKQVYELNLESMRKMQAERKENRAEFMNMRNERNERLKSILTTEQYAKLEQRKTERMNKKAPGNKRPAMKAPAATSETK